MKFFPDRDSPLIDEAVGFECHIFRDVNHFKFIVYNLTAVRLHCSFYFTNALRIHMAPIDFKLEAHKSFEFEMLAYDNEV